MRRKEKHIVNGAIIGFGLVGLVDIILQWYEHKDRGEDFTWDNYNGLRTIKRGLVGAVAGAGIGYLMYEYKISEEAKLPFNSDEYLKKILSNESLKADPILFQNVIEYREKMKQWLVDRFGNSLAAIPENGGSFHKKTAIASNYDLDIILPFKRESYSTLESMYNHVYEILGKEFSGKATVSKQTKAIGITFENYGNLVHFDVVPGREICNYVDDKDLNLYVRPDWIWQKGSSFKTNIFAQKNITVNKPEARRIIKLLKKYRDKNGLPLPTVIVEQCVVEALSENNYGVYTSDTENLLNGMNHIAQKLDGKKIIDIANSNNNLSDKVSSYYKNHISEQLYNDINKIETNPRYIKEIFEC
jgi:hypothetical protein